MVNIVGLRKITLFYCGTLWTFHITSNKNFLIPKPKINLFKSSLSYSGALVWNSIPLRIKNSSTLESFTNNCLKWMKCDSAM